MEDIKSLNIFERMMLITKEIGVIEKNSNVQMTQTNSYKAVSERDVLDNVKPLEKKYRIYSYPVDRKITESDILAKETEYNGKTTRTNTLFMRLEITYRFVNIDKPEEYIDIKTYGDGLDTGDKAPGKAMTYGDKYALMKAYKISTGDDPDKEVSPESGYKKVVKEEPKEDNKLILLSKFNELVDETNQDLEKILEYYQVKSNREMEVTQLKQAISEMERIKKERGEEQWRYGIEQKMK